MFTRPPRLRPEQTRNVLPAIRYPERPVCQRDNQIFGAMLAGDAILSKCQYAPIVTRPYQEITYVAWLDGRSDCLVVDPGLEAGI